MRKLNLNELSKRINSLYEGRFLSKKYVYQIYKDDVLVSEDPSEYNDDDENIVYLRVRL